MKTAIKPSQELKKDSSVASPPYQVGYARVSQAEHRASLTSDPSKSIERQVASLKQLFPDMPIHIDDGVSGTKTSREAWDRCVAEAKANAPAEIWCVWLDRIGRNHELKTLLPELYYEHRIQVKATDDTVPSLDEDFGSLVFDLRINMNCEESDRIGKRIRAGNTHVFQQGLNNRAHPGYLLYQGCYYPDDKPQHCPLPQRKECSGPVDQWGIHEDAHIGFSNFELLRLQVARSIKNDLSHDAAVIWMLKHFPLTRVERWDPVKGKTHHGHHGMESLDSIHEIKGTWVIAKTKPWGTLAWNATTLAYRCQSLLLQGYTAHRRDYNPNARPSRGQRSCSNNPHQRYEDANFETVSEDRTHVPVIDDELKAYLDAANRHFRVERETAGSSNLGSRSNNAAAERRGKPIPPDQAKLYELSPALFRACYCQSCGCRMHRHRQVTSYAGGKVYSYAICKNDNCPTRGIALSFERAVAGIAMQLADQARQLQNGTLITELATPRLHPAAVAKIGALEEDLEYFRSKPSNQVRLNQIAELERQISNLQSDLVTEEEDLRQMDAKRRLRHPRAVEPSTWIQLLTESVDTIQLVHLAIRKVLVGPADPSFQASQSSQDCLRRRRGWGTNSAVVTAIEIA